MRVELPVGAGSEDPSVGKQHGDGVVEPGIRMGHTEDHVSVSGPQSSVRYTGLAPVSTKPVELPLVTSTVPSGSSTESGMTRGSAIGGAGAHDGDASPRSRISQVFVAGRSTPWGTAPPRGDGHSEPRFLLLIDRKRHVRLREQPVERQLAHAGDVGPKLRAQRVGPAFADAWPVTATRAWLPHSPWAPDRPVQEKWSLRRHRPLSSGTHCIRLSAVGVTSAPFLIP